MNLLREKTALITGGSDGIGYGIARAFADEGANLILVGRDDKKLAQKKEILAEISGDVHCIAADLSCGESIDQVVKEVNDNTRSLDILVNNAGIARFIPFKNMTGEDLEYHWRLNVRAPYALSQKLFDELVKSGGNIINISSYFSRRMMPDRPSTAYSLSKGALESFTRALAFEAGPSGVRVNAIAPGTVMTSQVQYNYDQLDEAVQKRFDTMISTIYPLQNLGRPEDIAQMAVFLASDRAAWITGSVFSVDGGLTTN